MFSDAKFLHRHVRWIVLGLVLCMGAAIASPLVRPKSMSLVCAGTGAKALMLVEIDAEGESDKLLVMTLDCADCLPAVLPPPDHAVRIIEKPVQGRTAVAKSLPPPDAHCLSPPSRGPPTSVFPT